MRAAAAWVLHILSVHNLFILFTVGFFCLLISFWVKKKAIGKRFYLRQLLIAAFIVTLLGGFIFPPVNVWFLENYGMKGEAVIVNSFDEGSWFNSAPGMRLVLKIAPDEGAPFVEAVSTVPPLSTISHLQVGDKVEVLYSPQYTHDVAIASW